MEFPFLNFLKKQFRNEDFKVYSLAGDASSRKYYRVIKDQQSWVLMQWEPFDPENYPFLSVLNHFRNNSVNVPEVVGLDSQSGYVLLEDLGDLTLERKFWESQSQESSIPFYKLSIDEIIKIHFKATHNKSNCTAFKIKFDTEKFLWEMKYGQENLLAGICQFNFNEKLNKELTEVFTEICQRLDQEPKYIAHRDYHSRNLMIKFNEVRVIDFQDARLGPIQYDLVSLLRDSYVNLKDDIALQLIDYYLKSAEDFLPATFNRDHFDEIYELQTVQRCFKACGSFSSFYMQRKDTRYLKYISHTLKRVLKSLTEFPEYKLFADVLIDSGALERKYDAL
jgi:aminoglycoside/choline kinase family phosphotransferase